MSSCASTSRPLISTAGEECGAPPSNSLDKPRGSSAPWAQSSEKRFNVVRGSVAQPARKASKVSPGIAVGHCSWLTKQGLLARVSRPQQRSPRRAANSDASMPPSDHPPSQASCGTLASSSSSQCSRWLESSSGSGSISTRRCSSSPCKAAANGSSGEIPRPQPGSRISRSRMARLRSQSFMTIGQSL
ncbi:hypothetical protein D3C73_1139200 [compost metagenome]